MDYAIVMLCPLLTVASFVIGRRLMVREDGDVPPKEPTPSQLFGRATYGLANVIPISSAKRESFAKDLLASGDYRVTAVDDFLAKRNLGVLACLIAFLLVVAVGLADGYESILGVIAGVSTLIAYSLPRVALSGRASRRIGEIEKAIPDAMDMVAMSIQGGQPLPIAIGQVADRMQRIFPALSEELGIVFRQVQSGPSENAYDAFAKRIEIPEVIAWCAMMKQSQKLGGGLAQSLRDYAARIRIDRQSRAERSGNTASLKLLFPVVLCLAPPIAIVLIGPAVIELKDFISREKGATQAAIQQVQQ